MFEVRYAKGPVVYLYDPDDLETKKKELLWGDWLRIGADIDAEWSEVRWGRDTLAIRKDDYQRERVLEMIFLDVGQGDGCILTAPFTGDREKIMIIDAGDRDNMKGYLDYRFRDFKTAFRFHAAIITHPDQDHYRGFQPVFDDEQISFDHVYHNGILERTGDDRLGPVEDGFLTDIRASKTAAHALYSKASARGLMRYPKLLWTALDSDRFGDVSMLSTHHGAKEDGRTWLPGFAPSDQAELTIEILGPVVERAPNGDRGLRTFGKTPTSTSMNVGKTKNGHSVLLRLVYRDFKVLFGGDLNAPAEQFLMRHYGNDGQAASTVAEMNAMIERARDRFGVDMLKCCHHGSSDVTDEFLASTEPLAFVVSSGDAESHVHPRPDLLGLLGKKGRGARPLVLCTELLRSTREREDPELEKRLKRVNAKIDAETDAQVKQTLQAERDEIQDDLFKRNVGVYGAINLRTDGRKAVIAFRNEKPKGVKRWFHYELVQDDHHGFTVVGDGH